MGWSDLKHDLQRFLEWADVSVNCAETEARPALTVLALVLKDQVDEGVYRFVTPGELAPAFDRHDDFGEAIVCALGASDLFQLRQL